MVRHIVAAVLAAAVLVPSPTRAATEGVPPCPDDGFQPLDDPYRGPGLALLIPPLAFLQALARDHLADVPRSPVAFRVVGADGRVEDTAHVALLHDGRRFLGETLHGGSLDLPDGTYTVIAAVAGSPGRWGQRRITLHDGKPGDVEIRLDRVLPKVATRPPTDLGPDGRAPAGGFVRVAWSGVRQPAASLAVTPADMEDGRVMREARVGTGATSAIEMPPSEGGSYDVRLLLCAPRITLASWRVEVGPPQIRLGAPEKVTAGRPFDVTATGRLGGAFELGIVRSGTETEVQAEKADHTTPKVRLAAPLRPGSWDLVYIADDHDRTMLARRPITVEAAKIEISAPAEVRVGAPVTIAFPGSDIGEGAVVGLWTASGELRADRLMLVGERLPAGIGDYELRLVDRADRSSVLARRPIRIVGTMIRAPDTVAPGAPVAVTFDEEPAFFDRLRILGRGEEPVMFDRRPSVDVSSLRRARITAPDTPGDYDLAVVDESPGTQGAKLIDRRPLTVR